MCGDIEGDEMISLVERFKLLQPEVGVLHDELVKDGDGIYCLQITAASGRIFHVYTDDDGGSLSIEEVKSGV
jgi:hypothetical protein